MTDPVPSKEKLSDWLRRWYALKGELRFREAADEIERLEQCHREGWNYAREVEDEYKRRTGRSFADRSSPEPALDQVHSVVYDRGGWICSICHGWNCLKSKHCGHAHSGTLALPPGDVRCICGQGSYASTDQCPACRGKP